MRTACGRIEVDLYKLVTDVRHRLAQEKLPPIKLAVMGCVVNGPGECEGADVAIFAGKGKGIIFVQGEQKAIVPTEAMLDAMLSECRAFADKVARGEATLKNAAVDIKPPDPLPRGDGSVPLRVVRG